MPGFPSYLLLSLVAGAIAAPTSSFSKRQEAVPFNQTAPAWDAGAVTQFPIHPSCNVTQAHQIALGLNETIELAAQAKSHVLRWGNQSEIYRRYFGDRPPFEVVGAFEVIVGGDKAGILFRCDNPDGNCANEGWAGHWRGSNGTSETVICDLSYETRRPLSQMCALGYNVAESPTNTFWASDLMHRLFHVPAIGKEWIEHFTHDYDEVVELAAGTTNTTLSTRDSDTLQYFALEAYAHDIAVPGIGCPGAPDPTTPSAAAATATSSGSATVSQPPSATSSLPANCHTHDGGDVHCS